MRYTVQRKMYKDSDWISSKSNRCTANKIFGLNYAVSDCVADKANGIIFDWRIEDSLRETVLSEEQVLQALHNAAKGQNATV